MNYEEFLLKKQVVTKETGFAWPKERLPKALFEWQKELVLFALRTGRCALFEDCGMGKTPQQLAWAQAVSEHEGKPVLILAPLAVSEQTRREGVKFGIPVKVCRSQKDVTDGVNVANYEMLQHFDTSVFGGVVLDESSILKAYMGKTKRALVEAFKDTPYKLACTATPAPNDLMELLNHAEYLGIMRSCEALAIWFIADQRDSGTYRLKGHAATDFWRWVTTWAVCADRPSDIGYSDDGYILPKLNEKDLIIKIDELSQDYADGLLRKIDMSATGFYREKRITLAKRVSECARIVNESDEPYLVWCLMNEESEALKQAIPEATEVKGSDDPDKKEKAALDFIDGNTRVLIAKPSIFGFGLNFQHCSHAVFCGLDYSYEGYYQAVRRLYRYGQIKPVWITRVIGSTERQILQAQARKEKQRADMHHSMAQAMKEYQQGSMAGKHYQLNLKRQEATVPEWIREEKAI